MDDNPSDHPNPGLPAIAMVTHNSVADLRHYFASVVKTARGLGSPVVVVDNASTDGTLEFLQEQAAEHSEVRVSGQGRNLGYAGAVNIATSMLPSTDVMLVNPDVELGEQEVRDMTAYMHANPRVAVCAPRLVFADGTLQPSARRPASLAAMIGSVRSEERRDFFSRSYARYLAPAGSSKSGERGWVDVDWVIGAAMLIRREAFDGLGGFDPGFFLYMEDADFCRRCWAAGWRVVYLTGVSMQHYYSRASSAHDASVLSSAARRRHVRSLARYWRKHPGTFFGREAGRE